MRSFVTDFVHVLISLPLYLFIIFVVLLILAYRKKQPPFYQYRYLLTVITILIYLYSAPIFPTQLTAFYEHIYPAKNMESITRPDKKNLIIVLTSGWYRAVGESYELKIGEAGWERLVCAVRLWNRHGGRVLVTGFPDPSGSGSVAAAMADWMVKLGVSRDAILIEGKARNTYENLLYSKNIISDDKSYNMVLLTSAMRMPRAMLVAKKLDLDVTSFPCDFRADIGYRWQDLIPNNEGPLASERIFHELFGIIYYRLRGRI